MAKSSVPLTILLFQALMSTDSNRKVGTPHGCASCIYREEQMRDGGWCYMFKDMPSPSCSQHKQD